MKRKKNKKSILGTMKKHPIATVLLFFGLSASFAFGAWSFLTSSSFTGQVTSTGEAPVSFTATFDNVAIDTQYSANSSSSDATITNANGELNSTVSIDITKSDVVDDCTAYENDCTVELEIEGSVYEDGDNYLVPSGDSDLTATISCVKASCPQNVTVEVSLETA